ncbi:efflux RND transporter periplasmic adaptor subunit [Roseobacter sinensis]|uniref:Efflux RND transporter periplasmic adaptor subunit n=1 Tax=Roseobacter sinensis TaxID=2931391 RepID=A0ABT3BHK3_9RHOB|nr:efflux RND transporter periplasmic adaptor subunit [Roseobacter sp. WL0113]MCV3272594.1 efflux RND transporter periplasmic adaptor subunit [Roseobacter sp. WL0113]
MRIFSVLAALIVAGALSLFILDRPRLVALFGADDSDTPETEEIAAVVNTAEQETAGLVKVVVVRSIARQIDTAVALRGQTEAARTVDVRAETSAVVVSEPLRKGARVEAGQEMCRLDEGTRGTELAQARAQLDEAEARVPEAEARLTESLAQLEEARINLNASSKLSDSGFASTTRVANTEAALATAEAGVESARAGLRGAQSGIQTAQAAVATAEKEIQRLIIRAPFGGVLESDTAELGSLLQPGSLCATIIQLDPIKLVAFVPETEVARVELGANATARLVRGSGALTGDTDARGGEVRGVVTFVSNSADETTRTFRVEIEVPNTDNRIRDGQTAEIEISAEGATAHLLPQSALTLNDEGKLGIRTIDEEAIVAFHPVSLMRDTPEGVWLTGLPETAEVIVLGQEFVIEGVRVAPTYRELSQ